MTDPVEVPTSTPNELLAAGRRNLAVKEFTSAVETLAAACELLAKQHGDTADQCAEAYLWYALPYPYHLRTATISQRQYFCVKIVKTTIIRPNYYTYLGKLI